MPPSPTSAMVDGEQEPRDKKWSVGLVGMCLLLTTLFGVRQKELQRERENNRGRKKESYVDICQLFLRR